MCVPAQRPPDTVQIWISCRSEREMFSRSDSKARWRGDESSQKHVTFQSTNACVPCEIWGFCVLEWRDTRPSALLQASCFWRIMNISAETLVLKNGTAVRFSCWPKLCVFSLSVSAQSDKLFLPFHVDIFLLDLICCFRQTCFPCWCLQIKYRLICLRSGSRPLNALLQFTAPVERLTQPLQASQTTLQSFWNVKERICPKKSQSGAIFACGRDVWMDVWTRFLCEQLAR